MYYSFVLSRVIRSVCFKDYDISYFDENGGELNADRATSSYENATSYSQSYEGLLINLLFFSFLSKSTVQTDHVNFDN